MSSQIINFIIINSPVIGLIFFITVFCVVVITLLLPKNKTKFKNYSKIPLRDE
jgi:cbb3-type cytochrome oxidase subunit 3